MRKLSAFLFVLLLCQYISAQNLVTSRTTSPYTYFYTIDDDLALKIIKQSASAIDPEDLFYLKVDSFPTGTEYGGKLAPGNYLQAFINKNKVDLEFFCVPNVFFSIIENQTDLVIQIRNLTGDILFDSEVKINGRHIPYDNRLQAHLLKKSNSKGIVTVVYDGKTNFIELRRSMNNSGIERFGRKVAYGTPVKYIWVPLKTAVILPVNTVTSLIRGHGYGTARWIWAQIKRPFEKPWNYKPGYIVLNKPKFMPGDTVKVKAFITRGKKFLPRKCDADIKLALGYPRKDIKLASISPYTPGGYSYQFVLSDTLGLQLDANYWIKILKKGSWNELISSPFRYEYYDLKSTKLNLRIPTDVHYRGIPMIINLNAVNENDMVLPDARARIIILSDNVKETFGKQIFIPDTLGIIEEDLKPSGGTLIEIPDSVFPDANLSYKLFVRANTSDNESVTEIKSLTFISRKEEITYSINGDSITFKLKVDGIETKRNGSIHFTDAFGNSDEGKSIVFPFSMKIDPFYASCTLLSGGLKKTINLGDLSDGVTCSTRRCNDSIFIDAESTTGLKFNYFIYELNRERDRGMVSELHFSERVTSDKKWYLSVNYLWGGKMESSMYEIVPEEEKLSVEIEHPEIILPGQSATINLTVTDFKGNAVPGVDITAFSLTGKFKYSLPALPVMAKQRRSKELINSFTGSISENPDLYNRFRYNFWGKEAGLDTLEFYKFWYHKDDIYRSTADMKDSLTQFAVFVFRNGYPLKINMIYVNRRPVFIDMASANQPYSFRVDSGYHNISVRTPQYVYDVDSLWFPYGKKLFISIHDTLSPKSYTRTKSTPVLKKHERVHLSNFILPFRPKFNNGVAFIEQKGTFFLMSNTDRQLLNPGWNGSQYGYDKVGPILPANAKFESLGVFATAFEFEPRYEYDFAPGLLKMRSYEPLDRIPKKFSTYMTEYGYATEYALADKVLTRSYLEDIWGDIVKKRKIASLRYTNSDRTKPGNGSVSIVNVQKDDEAKPLAFILHAYNNYSLSVRHDYETVITNVTPGLYYFIAFYDDESYVRIDSVEVKANCKTILNAENEEIRTGHDMLEFVVDLINSPRSFDTRMLNSNERDLLQKFISPTIKQYEGSGFTVSGKVLEADDNSPLPGVSISIEGTTNGTITDLDGYYSLRVPEGKHKMLFRYIGFESAEYIVETDQTLDVVMEAASLALDEVIVVAHGYSTRSESLAMASSVTTVSSLSGRVAGVQVTRSSGEPSILIRGVSSIPGSNSPLIIINGVPYTGSMDDLDPSLFKDISVLKSDSIMGIYGSRASNGVILINTKTARFIMPSGGKGVTFDDSFMNMAMESGSLRKNFRDDAFWQPQLTTDDSGEVSFTAIFPDDITSWETFVIAMNGKRQSGTTQSRIKAFRPVIAQLAGPKYLTEGDSINLIGKIANYTSLPQVLTERFICNGDTIFNRKKEFTDAIIDTIPVRAQSQDSLRFEYSFITEAGLKDGEYRPIPVKRAGVEIDSGSFMILERDTVMSIDLNSYSNNVELSVVANARDLINSNSYRLINYYYECNEQMASKLIGFLTARSVNKTLGTEKMKDEREAKRIIRKLIDNQNNDGLWGWWGVSSTDDWISLHVLEALMMAKKEGYSVSIKTTSLVDNTVLILESPVMKYRNIALLEIMSELNAKIDFNRYLKGVDTLDNLTFRDSLRITLLKQKYKIPSDLQFISKAKKTTIFGNTYFSSSHSWQSVCDDDIRNTILAYEVLRNDTSQNIAEIKDIRNYFLECLTFGNNLNTYQTSGILKTILRDYIKEEEDITGTSLHLSGPVTAEVKSFPYKKSFEPLGTLTLEKKGKMPVFLSLSQKKFIKSPSVDSSDFRINTRFTFKGNTVKAGEPVKMIAVVDIQKKADYIMIEIPIPSGFSYDSKKEYYAGEDHREFYRDHVAIFISHSNPGKKVIEITLIPRFSGKFVINPAKISLMYFPTISSNNSIKEVSIK